MKFKNLEESMKQAEGNLKHENMKIEEWEKDLVRELSSGKINRKDFIQNVILKHKNEMKYDFTEDDVINPEYERENDYK